MLFAQQLPKLKAQNKSSSHNTTMAHNKNSTKLRRKQTFWNFFKWQSSEISSRFDSKSQNQFLYQKIEFKFSNQLGQWQKLLFLRRVCYCIDVPRYHRSIQLLLLFEITDLVKTVRRKIHRMIEISKYLHKFPVYYVWTNNKC